jgi:phosphoribosyl 1,2-cyclic phosphodiesterase
MEIKILASGSKGNCYVIDDGQTKLLLEAGIPFKQIQKALDFKVSEIHGCLISHSHADHSRAAAELARLGFEVYASEGTLTALNIESFYYTHSVWSRETGEQFQIRSWNILAFPVEHDASEPLGFLLQTGSERLLYATDTAYIRYRFEGLTHLMLECNYSLDLIKDNVAAGETERVVKRRVIKSHMSLETVKSLLIANDLSKVVAVYLLHLSSANSSAENFKVEIQKLIGKPVYIAQENGGVI